MAIIRSFGTVQSVAAPLPSSASPSSSGAGAWSGYAYSYATMYRTQPSVRTVVDFLARNVAQLGIHAFRRVSDTDRQRLADFPVIDWLTRPNPATTRYRLIESLMSDMGIYFNAFWLKVRMPQRLGLVRLPPAQVEVEGGLFPTLYRWISANGQPREFEPSEIVHFSGYDPENAFLGLSPLETLRRVLIEEIEIQQYRAFYWRNHARMDGVIERDKSQKPWLKEQWQSWEEQWKGKHTGRASSGGTAVLMPGMTWKDRTHSAKDSELNAARKLTREEVAREYHVPLPMVGILDHATFSNIKEQHKNLYQDALGPWLVMLEEELERQLLPEVDEADAENVYFEFNIAEKLKGSFEEQADGIMKLVGRPIMTANEGRARLNLSKIEGDPSADKLAKPLNTATPGDGNDDDANNSTALTLPPRRDADDDVDEDEELEAAAVAVIEQHRARQASRLEKLPAAQRPAAFNLTRYNSELASDLVGVGFEPDRARERASRVNADTLRALTAAIA